MAANLYSKAAEKGYPFIRGEGMTWNDIYYVRFTKTASGEGPALYVGFDPLSFSFKFKEGK